MTHTPGPWYEAQDEHDPDILMVTTKERTEQNYAPIANIDVQFSLAFDEEQRANARLIAAAPDLLDALRDMVSDRNELREGTIAFARWAIAKAEGRS